jgi:hypothetical protein
MTGEPGRYGYTRTCRGCGKPSSDPWCLDCDAKHDRDNFTARGEWSVCTRCGHVNGRHATGCPRRTP